MPLLRSDCASDLLATPGFVTIIVLVVLSFLSPHDTPAGGSAAFSPRNSHKKAHPAKPRIEDFAPRITLDTVFPDSPPREPIRLGKPIETPDSWIAWPVKQKILPSTVDSRGSGTLGAPVFPPPAPKPLLNSAALKPNLSWGTAYRMEGPESESRFALDLFIPAQLERSGSLFFESRAEYLDRGSRLFRSGDRRLDLGMGLGWRKFASEQVMIGANAFWDATRMDGAWYSAPGVGLEFALSSERRVWDIILNAYRGGGIDLTTGVTFPLVDDLVDMRLHVDKYRFFDGEFILGSRGGVEISSPNRLLTVSYELGQDRDTELYHAVSCAIAVPFSLDKLFSGKNPIERPQAFGRWPDRCEDQLQSDGVKRARGLPNTVIEARNTPQGSRWTTPGKLRWEENAKSKTDGATNKKNKETEKPACNCKCGCDSKSTPVYRLKLKSVWDLPASLLGAATYLACDYTYRSAFGPFELEPYEVERIKQEMPKSRTRK